VTEPRATARSDERIFEDEDPELADNQEFDHALAEGTESLAHGRPEEARGALEKALRYKPRNQRARNLLGLSLFKLGQLQRAEEIYRGLIEDHPADPTLRVNLGLVFLKSNSSAEAVRCFETALDLTPTHQKAQNYLGLALAQKGELLRAREWFLKAGNEAMAQRMAQALQQSPIRDVAAGAEEALSAEQPFKPAAQEEQPAEEAQKHWVASTPSQPAAPPIGTVVAPEPSSLPAVTAAEAVEEAVATSSEPSALSMAQYTLNTRLSVPNGDGGGFIIGANEVLVQVKGEMLTRLDGLVASWGQVTMKPEMKRFRGKATDKPFGDGARRMLRAAGEGRFVVAREGRRFTALELGDEPAYFREETLFAFEESIVFENGRVPSKGGPDLHLVHLRGRGKLLLATVGVPQAVDVLRGEALRVPMEQLVGWHGPLIQPRLVQMVEDAPEMGVALELVGEGRALLDVPAEK
jgi:Flp pilus assembly protein TadD/uncharacterized protein (AIM24 family)